MQEAQETQTETSMRTPRYCDQKVPSIADKVDWDKVNQAMRRDCIEGGLVNTDLALEGMRKAQEFERLNVVASEQCQINLPIKHTADENTSG